MPPNNEGIQFHLASGSYTIRDELTKFDAADLLGEIEEFNECMTEEIKLLQLGNVRVEDASGKVIPTEVAISSMQRMLESNAQAIVALEEFANA